MIRGKRGVVTALVACAGLSFAVVQAPASELDAISLDKQRATRVLQSAKEIFSPAAPGERREATSALAELAASLPYLRGAERRQARALLARPDDPIDPFGDEFTEPEAKASPLCSNHFCVHWVSKGGDAPPGAGRVPNFVKEALKSGERSFKVEVKKLGWKAPKPDRGRSGNSKTDIFLKNIDKFGLYGYAAPDPGQRGLRRFAYLVVDNDYKNFQGYPDPILPLQVTMAHEYNHVLQFNYDTKADGWLFESVATFMEEQVYPTIDDYVLYTQAWANLTEEPLTIAPGARNGIKVYGNAIWTHFIARRFGVKVARIAWEIVPKTKHFAVEAHDQAIKKRGGEGFSQSFVDFSAEVAELRASNAFPDSGEYADVERTQFNANSEKRTLDHTVFHLLNVKDLTGSTYTLTVKAPNGLKSGIALVGRTGGEVNGDVVKEVLFDGNGGTMTVTLNNPGGLSRLSAVLVNADGSAKINKRGPDYTKDNQDFRATLAVAP